MPADEPREPFASSVDAIRSLMLINAQREEQLARITLAGEAGIVVALLLMAAMMFSASMPLTGGAAVVSAIWWLATSAAPVFRRYRTARTGRLRIQEKLAAFDASQERCCP